MLEKDIATNKKIGQFGGDDILARNSGSKVRLLTHCNTGSLATAGYGTALGRFAVTLGPLLLHAMAQHWVSLLLH